MNSGLVDARTVEMRFDNSNFEKNAKQSMSTLDKLKNALKLDGASTGLKEVERASEKLDFRDFKNNIDGVGKRFSALETIATGALLKIGASAAEAGERLVKSLTVDQLSAGWNKYEEKTTSVQTIMANLKDDVSKFANETEKLDYVSSYLDKLLWFSDETSYSFTDMTSNVGKFIANGQGLEESVTAMQGIASWAAVSGQNTQVAARAMYNISQAMGAGSMMVKDWMSIENANMATSQFKELAITIAQKKGKIKEGQVTVENFRETLSGKDTKGWFDKDVMMEVFETYGEAANRIQEYAEAHDVTSTEAIRKIKETDKTFADSLGFKAFAAAQEAKTFGEVVSATADAVSTKWMRIFENIFGNYLEAKELWTDLSEQMWEIFASPLDTLNEIMEAWNKGFLEKSPSNIIEQWFDSGRLDKLDNGLNYITLDTAELAVASDEAHYRIEELADGTKQLVKLVEDSSGRYKRYVKNIYDSSEYVISGRETLLKGFQNIFDAVIHDVYDEDGNLESMSFFGTFTRGLQEALFGTSELEEIVPLLSKKLWNLTKRFSELTENLIPSAETADKLKNTFKGLFSIFKMAGKFISSVIKPFKNLFGELFNEAPGDVLDLADALSSWIQRLEEFFDESKTFDNISSTIKSWLDGLLNGLNELSKKLTGLPLDQLKIKVKGTILDFLNNFDFKEVAKQIQDVKTGNLPDKLTPFQEFLIKGKKIFEGIRKVFTFIAETISKIFGFFNERIDTGSIFEAFKSIAELFKYAIDNFAHSDFLKKVFDGVSKAFQWILNFLGEIFGQDGVRGILKIAAKVGILAVLFGVIYTIYQFLSGIEGFASLFDGVYDVLESFAFKQIAEAFKSFGVGLLILSGAIAILSSIDLKSLTKGIVAIGLMVLIFYAFKELTKSMKGSDGLKASSSLLIFAAAVGLLTRVTAILGNIESTILYRGLTAILIMTLIFSAFSKLVKSSQNLAGAVGAFALFGVAVNVLAVGVALLSTLNPSQLLKSLAAIGTIVGIFILFGELSKETKGVFGATLAFSLFAVAVDILSVGVGVLSALNTSGLTNAVFAIGTLAGIFILFGKLSKETKGILGATLVFGLFAVAVDILSVGVGVLSALNTSGLTNAVFAIGTLVGIFILFGKLSKETKGILGAIVAFTAFGVAIDILSVGVGVLSALNTSGLTNAVFAIGTLAGIFILFGKLSKETKGIFGAIVAFTAFGVAIDIISIGVMALAKLNGNQLTRGIVAIGALLTIFALFNKLSGDGNGKQIASILAFSVAFVAISASLNLLIPVMKQITDMGDDWWKPLIFFAGALGLLLIAGAVSGTGMVTVGLLALSAAIVSIGLACLMAGFGIESAAVGISILAEAIAKYGLQAAVNLGVFINALLDTIIASGPKLAKAAAISIGALAAGIGMSSGQIVGAAIALIVSFIVGLLDALVAGAPTIVTGFISAINAIAEAIRFSAPILTKAMMGLIESLVEAVIVGIATIVEPWGDVGKTIADKIVSWVPGLRQAFGVAEDAASSAGEDAASAYADGYSEAIQNESIDAKPNIEPFDISSLFANSFGAGEGSSQSIDISSIFNTDSIDLSSLTGSLSGAFEDMDFAGIGSTKIDDLSTALKDGGPDVSAASKETADKIEEPIKNLNSRSWGSEIAINLADGIRSEIPSVDAASSDLASAVAKYIHFSEPDLGPLSDFHTYAPDMIKLWCDGISKNLWRVDENTKDFGDSVRDGFVSALGYVSDLIDNGMTDQLTIRPIMDLSEIQNGVRSIDGMMSSARNYEIIGTSRLAASAAYGITANNSSKQIAQPVSAEVGPTNNTFYITNSDPNAVAEKVSRILGNQTRRQKAVWDYK